MARRQLPPRGPQVPDPRSGFSYWHSYEHPLPELPAFTHINEAKCTASHVLRPHTHPHLEICYFHAGRARWRSGGVTYDLGPGDFFLSRPGEVHEGEPDPTDPNHNFAVGFDPAQLPWTPSMALLAAAPPPASGEVRAAISEAVLVSGEGAQAQRRIPGGHGAEVTYRRILHELDGLGAQPSPARRQLARAMVQALLVELLVLVARCALDQQEAREGPRLRLPRATFRRLLAWLPTQLSAPPSLAAMAAQAGLTPTHFALAFRRELGETPLSYVTGLRLEEARRRLRRGVSVTETALGLGFSTPQYFSVVFRKRYRTTPSAYQRAEAP